MGFIKINKSKKRSLILLLSSIVILKTFTLTSSSYKVSAEEILATQTIDANETIEQVLNPDRGFYTMLPRFTTNPSTTSTISTMGKYVSSVNADCQNAKAANENLLFLEINLTQGADGTYISSANKVLLNEAFQAILNNDMKVVVRATYSSSGSTGKEPTDINTIYSNIKDLCEVFNKNKGVITVIEAGLLGPWGEMHSSRYLPISSSGVLDATYLTNIINTYLNNLDSSIQLNVRRPSYYRAIFKTNAPIVANTAYSGTKSSRVGFYNDGYLGSESDLGTYSDWTRSQELVFQDSHNRYTIFGGEAVLESESPNVGYALDSDAAITDMSKTHITYLNDGWNKVLLDLWASDTCSFGQNGYDYISNHLGYRFVLKKSELSSSVSTGGNMQVKVDIKNTGFGNLIRNNKVQVVFKSGDKSYIVDTNVNPRFWESGATKSESISVPVPLELTGGKWNVYLKLKDRTGDDASAIKFANKTGFDATIHANYIGIVNVTANKMDFDNNSIIDIQDMASLAVNYNMTSSNSKWNYKYDLNGDKIIDIYDIVIISKELK